MVSKIIGSVVGLSLMLAATFWWLMIEGTPPATGTGEFDVMAMRAPISGDAAEVRPVAINLETVGSDVAPGFAAQTGEFGTDYSVAYTAIQIVFPDASTLVIGGAVDSDVAHEMTQSPEQASFSDEAYSRLLTALEQARLVTVTHGHSDHIIAIARNPRPSQIAPNLHLTQFQVEALAAFSVDGEVPAAYRNIAQPASSSPQRIAPGVTLIPTPGHTPTSQSFFIQLADGREYLLIGDIVWKMSNITDLQTRPRLLQYMLFDPAEDRKKVLAQIRELYELQRRHPAIIIVPSHDRNYLEDLVAQGALGAQFTIN